MADRFRFQYKVPADLARALANSRQRLLRGNGRSITEARYIFAVLQAGFDELQEASADGRVHNFLRDKFYTSFNPHATEKVDEFMDPIVERRANDLKSIVPRDRRRKGRIYIEALLHGLMLCGVLSESGGRLGINDPSKWQYQKLDQYLGDYS